MEKIARFWEEKSGDNVQCALCPRECLISPGEMGVCRARKNMDGKLYTMVYAEATSANSDPIEKKPLYHFYPGSRVFSMSTAGCNLECKHCQNWRISRSSVEDITTEYIEPEEAVDKAKRSNCQGIAYTYGEPVIWFEYALDTAKLANEEGLYNVFVTNGYMNLEAWEELGPYLDWINVDVKGFRDELYQEVCGVPSLEPVLKTCEWAFEQGIHLELTYLVIPDENDDTEQLKNFCSWVAEDLGENVPVHFSRFRPMYKMTDKSSTPISTLEKAHEIAENKGLDYVYLGNVPGHDWDNTYCPNCEELLISRSGFSISEYNLDDKKCPKCGKEISIKGEHHPPSF